MNHLLAKSVMRRLISGGGSIRSASPAPSLTIFRAVTESATARRESLVYVRGGGVELMKRMMSSEAVKVTEEKKEVKEEEKKSESNVVVSSYWGVARPRITKEDGTEWPWNCFMVITLFTSFIFCKICAVSSFFLSVYAPFVVVCVFSASPVDFNCLLSLYALLYVSMCVCARERGGRGDRERERAGEYVCNYVCINVCIKMSIDRSREREYVCIKMSCQLLHHLFMLCTVVSVFVFAY